MSGVIKEWFVISEEDDRVNLRYLFVTSEIKPPVVLVEIAMECRIIQGLYLLSILQGKHSVFKMDNIVNTVCNRVRPVYTFCFIPGPIQRRMLGRRHYVWIQ